MRLRVIVALVAFVAYLPGFWWGAPTATAADRTNAWGVDDEPPLGPLAQAHDFLHPKKDVPPNLGYPMLHPIMVLGVFTPYMGYLYLTKQVRNPTVAYPHGFTDAEQALRMLTYLAHFLSVLLAVGVVVAAFEIGRVLWDDSSGIAAALGAGLVYPMFYYARNSNVDMPVLFFTAVALVAFAHILRWGISTRRLLVFGTLVGLAVATKEPSFASFVFAPFVLPFLPDERGVRAGGTVSFWGGAIGAALCAFAAYALGSGMVVDHARWSAHIDFVLGRMSQLDAGAITWVHIFPNTPAGNAQLAVHTMQTLARAVGWPGLALGIVGMIAAARTSPRQSLLALSAIGYLLVLGVSTRTALLRYVMPAAFVLAIFGARLVVVAWSSRQRSFRWLGAAAGAAAGLLLLAWGVDLTDAMLRDSRYDAGRWIAARAQAGDSLEYFGSEHKNPPMPATLGSHVAIPFLGSTFRPDTTPDVVNELLARWKERGPRFVVLLPDYTSAPGAPYSRACPPSVYRDLESGTIGYRRVALFQTPTPLSWTRRPALDYPVVNPPIRIYEREASAGSTP